MVNLDVRGLGAVYNSSRGPVYAVDDVNFVLHEGESLGIAGESACGKSTLGLSIMQMLDGANTKGTILFDGVSLLELSNDDFDRGYRWKKISMIFQGAMNSLDPVFTIKDQFLEILKQHHCDDGDVEQLLLDAVTSVKLDANVLQKYPHELSGGMKQRIIIAMALLLKPQFVIADEPTTALDVLIQAQIINLLKHLKQKGMSFKLITHDLAVLSEISDRIGIMYGGQMVEFGSSEEIYNNPKHPYTKGLLDSIPQLHGNPPKYIKGTPPILTEKPHECRFIERCPLAIEKCKQLPPMIKTKTGYVRCWLYEDESI